MNITLEVLIEAIPLCFALIQSFFQSITQPILVINIKNSVTCFGSLEPSSGKIQKHSTGIFSECAHYGIPYWLQYILTLKFMFNSVS